MTYAPCPNCGCRVEYAPPNGGVCEACDCAFAVEVNELGHWCPVPRPHEHDWFRCHRYFKGDRVLCYVEDCACGARRRVYPGEGVQPDIVRDAISPGGSIKNALIDYTPETGFLNPAGDPQGDRMRLLAKGEIHGEMVSQRD